MRSLPRSSFARSRCALSLLEVLFVLAIITVLATFSAWSVPGVIRGAKLRDGGAALAQASELARQSSMARNTLSALVVLTGETYADERLRAFAVIYFDPATQAWTPLTEWLHLPDGTSISEKPGHSSFLSGDALEQLELTHRGSRVQGSELAARIYTPAGQVLCSEANLPLGLRVAAVTDAEALHAAMVEINPQNGRARVRAE